MVSGLLAQTIANQRLADLVEVRHIGHDKSGYKNN